MEYLVILVLGLYVMVLPIIIALITNSKSSNRKDKED